VPLKGAKIRFHHGSGANPGLVGPRCADAAAGASAGNSDCFRKHRSSATGSALGLRAAHGARTRRRTASGTS
jgi:hypothetical protein